METITLPLLNLVTLDQETQTILDQTETRERLSFIREAILDLAIKHGYWPPENQPVYMPVNKWKRVQEAKTKSRSVDYAYVIGYFWLRALPEFSYKQKSEIIREAIKAYAK